MNPIDATYTYNFTLNSNTFSMGLYILDAEAWPDILTPILLIQKEGQWEIVKQYDTLWTDIQELGPEYLSGSIVKAFNKALEEYTSGGELTFNQELTAIFQLRLALVGELLVLKDA